jgi:hypothetical protein
MARRKQKKTRRRDTAISITGLAESILIANVGTVAAFNLNLKDFIMDGWTAGSTGLATHPNQLSLHEIIYGNASQTSTVQLYNPGTGGTTSQSVTLTPGSNLEVITQNLRNNWVPALIQGTLIPVGFRVSKRVLRKPIAQANKLLKQAGLRSMVKV